jgi:hypothetical protein
MTHDLSLLMTHGLSLLMTHDSSLLMTHQQLLLTLSAELDLGGEEWHVSHAALHVGALGGHVAVEATQAGISKQGSSIGHGQSGRALQLDSNTQEATHKKRV